MCNPVETKNKTFPFQIQKIIFLNFKHSSGHYGRNNNTLMKISVKLFSSI